VLTLEEAVRLHGHLGPWLVLGYRIGATARERMGAGPAGIRCVAFIPLKRPFTCALDGIQAATGCTVGKLNLELRESAGSIAFVFEGAGGGRRLVFRLKEGVPKLLQELIERKGVEGAAVEVMAMRLEDLVDVEG